MSNENYHQRVQLIEAIRRGQEPLWNDPQGGLKETTADQANIQSLQKKGIDSNTPISHLLDESSYNTEQLQRASQTLIKELAGQHATQDMNPEKLAQSLSKTLPELVNAVLNDKPIEPEASPQLVSLIGEALIQPSMVYVSNHCKPDYLDAWELNPCPVCGRLPSIVVKPEEGVWRFKCSFCWTEYKMDIFTCPSCGSQGAENKEFLLVGENQEYEVASCHNCKRYYKIINRPKLEQPIPQGLEDLYTEVLDDLAEERGLIRLDS